MLTSVSPPTFLRTTPGGVSVRGGADRHPADSAGRPKAGMAARRNPIWLLRGRRGTGGSGGTEHSRYGGLQGPGPSPSGRDPAVTASNTKVGRHSGAGGLRREKFAASEEERR